MIQGLVVQEYMQKNINRIKELLPDAEIIVSTWENANIDGIECDKLILNKEPEAEYFIEGAEHKLNINRMLLSTKEGIKQSTRKYILKLRSDLRLDNINFLKEYFKYPVRNPKYVITKERIVCISIFSLEYEEDSGIRYYTPFHVSDWCCFGLAEDIRMLFDIELVDAKDYSQYFRIHNITKRYPISWMNDRLWRYPPEQYITSNLARKKFEFRFDHCLDYDEKLCGLSENIIINNFIIVDANQFRLKSCKKVYEKMARDITMISPLDWAGVYRNYTYKKKYKQLCDPKYRVGLDVEGKKRRLMILSRKFMQRVKMNLRDLHLVKLDL